jgi:hypothetical protein
MAIFILLRVGPLVVTDKMGFGLDLLASYSHNSGLQEITALSLIYKLYSSPLHTQ